MERIQEKTSQIVNSGLFRYFILAVILLSGVIVGIETYPEFHARFAHSLHLIDQTIIYIFLVEIILKLLANGKRPWDYFRDPWNVFDFIIVAVCFIPHVDTHYVMVLRLARILRVFRVISIFPKLQLLVNALLKSIPSMGYVVVLLFLVFYIYAVVGSFLFAKSDPVHFGSLHVSMITLFKVLTLEGWTDIMNTHIYGPVSNGNMQIISLWPFIYFASFILIGAMIIMNLFIGVIMNSMQESQNELSQELKEIKFQDIKSEELYVHLISKIDELRNEIQSLNKMRKE